MTKRRSALITLVIFGAVLLGNSPVLAGPEEILVRVLPREVIEARLREYGGTNRERGDRIRQMYADAGCSGNLTEQSVRSSTPPNVICVLPGSTKRVIIVGAHFDRVPTSDGVADNWSGASLLPSLYESVKYQPRLHTFAFVAFTDEEKGLIGSHFYAHHMTPEQVAATDAMVNMDTLGLAPTEMWQHRSDKRLMLALLSVARRLEMPLGAVNFEYVGSTDSESFASRKIPRITIHSLTQKSNDERILHTPKDKLSAMNLDEYYQTYHLLAVYLGFLDQVLGQPEATAHD